MKIEPKPVICIPYSKLNTSNDKYQKIASVTKEYYSKLSFPIFYGDTSTEQVNRSVMRNNAVKEINYYDYNLILFFDVDIIVPYQQIQQAIDLAHESNEMVIMYSYLILMSEMTTNQFYRDNFLEDKHGTQVKHPPSGAFIVPRNIWEAVGGQDERFTTWGGEDRAFYFACAAVKNKREVRRIQGKAWHLWHPQKRHTMLDLTSNVLLQRYLTAVGACPRFTVPNSTLKDNSAIFSILREKGGPLNPKESKNVDNSFLEKFIDPVKFTMLIGKREEIVERNSPMYKILKSDPQFQEIIIRQVKKQPVCNEHQILFKSNCGFYEKVEVNSPAYKILKEDPQFTIIQQSKQYPKKELCVLSTTNRQVFKATQKWINKHFSHLYSSEDYVIVLGYNVGESIHSFKKRYLNRKVIVYQLEQLYNYGSQWYNPKSNNPVIQKRTKHIKEWLDNADEIWDYDLDNKEFLETLGYKVKHVPLSVDTDLGYKITVPKKLYDLVFYGAINDKRFTWLEQFDKKYKLLFIGNPVNPEKYKLKYMLPPAFEEDLFQNVLKAEIALNLHYYDSNLQEQIRLFELLSNNVKVISEKSKRNYLNIPEFETFEEACTLIDSYLKEVPTVIPKISKTPQKIKVGAAYNSFYGLEFLERSIISLRKEVDYIVLVHQNKSLKGEPEPKDNERIIKSLIDRKFIDEIVYIDNTENLIPEQFVLKKRNAGLELCRKHKCQYIIPLDTDEVYNGYELLKEIYSMQENNIDTLYSPIISYYYNEFYSFLEDYYVPSAYKIDDRIFTKTTSSVLVDPVRKMQENNYKISNVIMHHYTYLYQYYKVKTEEAISAQVNPKVKTAKYQLLSSLQNFDGTIGHVFCNDKKTGLRLKQISLNVKK